MKDFQVDTSMCVHCGLCLPSCPTYQVTGSESESPRGRVVLLDAVREALSSGRTPDPTAWGALDHCLDCRACEAVCPAHVPVGHAVEELRGLVPGRPSLLLNAAALGSPSGVRRFRRWVRVATRPGVRRILRAGTSLPAPWGPMLSLAGGAPTSQSAPSQEACRESGEGSGVTVRFFWGCVMEGLYARTNRRSAELLRRLGYVVQMEDAPLCCGALARHQGDPEGARRWARSIIARFEESGAAFFVTNAAGCGAAFKEYGAWFREDPEWAERARAFAGRVRDLLELVDLKRLPVPRRTAPDPVTVHDACHLVHAQGIRDPVRAILQRAGIPVVEMVEADLCCGSAGIYNLSHPEMARALRDRKVGGIPPGVTRVVTSNPGCLLQIQSGLRERGLLVDAVHWVDVVYDALWSGKGEDCAALG